jgi:inorganic pyrophosphatase
MTPQTVTAIERNMNDISRLPHELDRKKRQCKAIIETPKGRRTKFKYENDSGLFSLSKVLPQGFSFPFDFGFIPSTIAEDGDPADVIVLMEEPAHVGCLLQVRLLGAIKIMQTEDGKTTPNDRLVAVPVQSQEFAKVQTFDDLRGNLTEEVADFLGLYNKNSDIQDEVTGTCGPEEAMDLLEKAARTFEESAKRK